MNVAFKRGLSTALTATNFTVDNGTFYLTTDTHRLYVGQDDKVVELNRYVLFVDKYTNFPTDAHEGDFAFASEDNILAVYKSNGTKMAWVQINPDTYQNTKLTAAENVTVSSATDGITVSFNLKQQTYDQDGGTVGAATTIPVSFKIAASDFATANHVAVGMKATAGVKSATLATDGDGADVSKKVTLTAGDNVDIAVSGSDVTISAIDSTYAMSGADNAIKLTSGAGGVAGSVAIEAGNKIAASVADDKLSIAHASIETTHTNKTTAQTLTAQGEFTAVTALTADDGHVTGYTTQKYKLPTDTNTTYDLNVAAGEIALVDSAGGSDKVAFVGGTNITVATDVDTKKFTVNHQGFNTTKGASTATDKTPNYGGTFEVVDSIETSNGHVTKYNTKTVTLPALVNTKLDSVAATLNNEGDISVTVKDTDGTSKTATVEGGIYLTLDGNKVFNQNALDVYTKAQVDNKIKGINAMVYRGTVGGTGATLSALPATGVQNGDTYMVHTSGTYQGIACAPGDLFIATGTEGADGIIPELNLSWTHVPAGDDTDTHYSLSAANNVITLNDTTSGAASGAVTIAAGSKIDVATAGNTITVKHAGLAAPTKETDETITGKNGESFTVLKSITSTDGHVTGYKNAVVTLPEQVNYESALSLETGHVIKNTVENGKSSSVTFANDSYITLTDDTTADKLTVGHKSYGALAATPGTALTPDHGGDFTVVTGVERDGGGHLSKVTTQKVTLPSVVDHTYSFATAAGTGNQGLIKVTGGQGDSKDLVVSGGTAIDVSGAAAGLTVKHANVSNTPTTSAPAQNTAGSTVTMIDTITVNAQGHVTGYNTKTVTLPADTNTIYDLSGTTTASGNSAVFTAALNGDGGENSSATFTLKSDSLTVAVASGAAKVDLEWGSF